jgi:hypothetical protein
VQKDVRLAFQLNESGFFDGDGSGQRPDPGAEEIGANASNIRYPSLEELLTKAGEQFGSLEYRRAVGEWVVFDGNGIERTFGQSPWDAIARFWLNSHRSLDREYRTNCIV